MGLTNIELTLTKTVSYDLLPFGKFYIKMIFPKYTLLNFIQFKDLHVNYNSSMPLNEEQEKKIIQYMKEHNTDILSDGKLFYTCFNFSLVEVSHPSFIEYKINPEFKQAVDTNQYNE